MGCGLYLSICLGFFLGPPEPCLHIFWGVIDVRYHQKGQVRKNQLLSDNSLILGIIHSSIFISCMHAIFPPASNPHKGTAASRRTWHLNLSGFPFPARNVDALKYKHLIGLTLKNWERKMS